MWTRGLGAEPWLSVRWWRWTCKGQSTPSSAVSSRKGQPAIEFRYPCNAPGEVLGIVSQSHVDACCILMLHPQDPDFANVSCQFVKDIMSMPGGISVTVNDSVSEAQVSACQEDGWLHCEASQ